jgi:hypothetical protein
MGDILGGAGALLSGAASIAGAITSKDARRSAERAQQQFLGRSVAFGEQGTALGFAQLDLGRQLANRQIELANALLEETQPFRRRLRASLGIESDPTVARIDVAPAPVKFAVTPAERDTLESQFRNARESVLAHAPVRGGALVRALVDLDTDRALAVTGLESEVARRNTVLENAAIDRDVAARTAAANLAAQIGFSAPGTAIPALSTAAGAFSPAAGGAVVNPALAATSGAAGAFGATAAAASAREQAAGASLGQLAAFGALASLKQQGRKKTADAQLGLLDF